jgi:lipopolysaccharide transport system permease protein
MGELKTARQQPPLPQPDAPSTSGPASEPAEQITIIQPSRGWVALRLGELWEYRELLYFLIWRDIKVRYKQTALGVAWAIIQPLFTMLVFNIFFGRLGGFDRGLAVPYALFNYTALVPWALFSNGLVQSSNSLVGSASLIKKVYFPRLVVPIATVLAGVIDFTLAFAVLLGMMAFYGVAPTPSVLLLPLFLVLALVAATGAGLWLSALNVEFRDVRYVVPLLTQLWLLASPIAYPSTLIREPWRTFYGINPMVGVVEGFRWALLGLEMPSPTMLVLSTLAALALLVSGAFYFRRMERSFADVV